MECNMKKVLHVAHINSVHKNIIGNISGITVDVTYTSGNVSSIYGDVSNISGNLDDAEITSEDRSKGVNIKDL